MKRSLKWSLLACALAAVGLCSQAQAQQGPSKKMNFFLTSSGGGNGAGDKPNRHDILTGSDAQGRAHPVLADTTCGNWTKSGAGAAQVGHSDRTGLTDSPPAHSWNMSHLSRGCSQDNLKASGGDGL